VQNSNFLDFKDVLLAIPFFLLIILISFLIKAKYIDRYSEYKYFVPGIIFKILGVICFCLVYVFYYKGGDTLNYFLGAKALGNLLIQDFDKGLNILLNTSSPYNSWNSFNIQTGYPRHYMWKDANTFIVSRLSAPLYIIGLNSFLTTSFLTACFSYFGVWKLYRLFNILYPRNQKVFAYLILFLPTLIFWGGGIMKDSFVLGSTCWITYNFYKVLIERKKIFWNSTFLILNILLIINIKPYVIISLIPGMLLWLNSAYLKNLRSNISKILVFPILLFAIIGTGFFLFNNLSSLMGVYGDVDTAIQQAQVIQEDLLREDQYGGNNYKIGSFDGSFGSLLAVAPIAIFTALYRPLFWEIGSPTMAFSVFENTVLIFFSIFIIIRVSPLKLIKILWSQPFLFYCFIFSIFFAFGVGIAGTNFGALVRYKLPLMPFFFTMIYIVYRLTRAKNDSA
tara:strand:- start:935 stop:2287 length:1353 start_codon:yes stop_codon:yes gene_type:complete